MRKLLSGAAAGARRADVVLDVAYVALGSNLGDRQGYLARARRALASIPHTRLLAESTVEETAPLGLPSQGPYLNQMVALETELSPRDLFAALQRIEHEAGRTRDVRWGPRTLDLDIVRFERQTVAEQDLQVPHPAAEDRDFWRRELEELRARLDRDRASSNRPGK
jgi:2-amino-4-hydroxy-6-hydroxymethyldihydropteridine diphosphokinase